MSRNITILFVIVALVLGFLAAVVAKRYIEQATAGGRSAIVEREAVTVVVAKQDIAMASTLTAGDVRVEAVPRSIVPDGALTDPKAVVGRGAAAAIARGEIIREGRLTAVGVGGGLPGLIKEGYRAITVKVNEVVGVAGFIVPGTYVDVLTTIRRKVGDRNEPETRMILQNVRVLAAGPYLQRDREDKPVTVTAVTLELLPDQAEMVSHAQNEGELRLALRNRMDQELVATPGTDTNFLLVGRQVSSGGRGVEVVLGTEVTQQSY